jgi:DNA-directed RNA polymerase III subunit RPC1
MQRRLVKSLEDLCCQYDSTVRNSTGEIIQFVYGGDGLDPTYMEAKDRPVDFQRALDHIKAASPFPDEEPLDDNELPQAFNTIMETDSFTKLGEDFKHELRLI